MNVVTRLALLGALLMASSCKHREPPRHDPPPCPMCDWANFVDKPLRVKRIECTNQGKPEHCHLTTENFEPRREVTVTFDKATGAYKWTLVTVNKPADRMDCPNLAADANNKRVIAGTCIITESDHGPAIHFFRATLAPKEEDPKKAGVYAQFQHTPFDSYRSHPVHDGHIHAEGEDGGP